MSFSREKYVWDAWKIMYPNTIGNTNHDFMMPSARRSPSCERGQMAEGEVAAMMDDETLTRRKKIPTFSFVILAKAGIQISRAFREYDTNFVCGDMLFSRW